MLHRCPNTAPKAGSGKSCQMGRASEGPGFCQFNSDVGIYGILSEAAMQDVGENGYCHDKLCAGQSGDKYPIFQ